MRPHFLGAAAALMGGALLFLLTARAEPSKEKSGDDLPVSGKANPNLASFDRVMEKVVREHHVPGRGAGRRAQRPDRLRSRLRLRRPDKKEPVEPNSLFRIASVTKPFTAVAVLQLVERGKLASQRQGLPCAGAEGAWTRRSLTTLEERHHFGTCCSTRRRDRDKSFDPMFRSPEICKEMKVTPPADQEAIIHYMLPGRSISIPANATVYSNFGYCLLGRVDREISEKKIGVR